VGNLDLKGNAVKEEGERERERCKQASSEFGVSNNPEREEKVVLEHSRLVR
jgi:hypothetical protein